MRVDAARLRGIGCSAGDGLQGLGVLPNAVIAQALIIGTSLMAGSYFSKRLLLRIPAERFHLLMEGVMLLSGLTLIAAAFF